MLNVERSMQGIIFLYFFMGMDEPCIDPTEPKRAKGEK